MKTATETETDLPTRKVIAMVEWADVLTRSTHDALERMDSRISLVETRIARVREVIARRYQELRVHDSLEAEHN